MTDTTLTSPLCCTDPVAFEQVWNRVMAGRSNPIAVNESVSVQISSKTQENGSTFPVPTQDSMLQTTSTLPCVPAVPQEDTTPLPCFGEWSVKTLLETAILSAHEGLEAYKKLERQLPLKLKPLLLESLQKRKKVLNQLETAYFLLVGEDFLSQFPSTTQYIHSPPVPAEQRLRTLFRKTQELQLLFKKSALETEDVCFTTLFLQLDKDLKEEISTLHRLVESLFWLRCK